MSLAIKISRNTCAKSLKSKLMELNNKKLYKLKFLISNENPNLTNNKNNPILNINENYKVISDTLKISHSISTHFNYSIVTKYSEASQQLTVPDVDIIDLSSTTTDPTQSHTFLGNNSSNLLIRLPNSKEEMNINLIGQENIFGNLNNKGLVVALGGTFDSIHEGHKLLLATACLIGRNNGKIIIGITSDKLVEKKFLGDLISNYSERSSKIVNYILENSNITHDNLLITPLDDSVGIAGTLNNLNCLVLTRETINSIDLIESTRKSNHLQPLTYLIIDDMIQSNPTLIKKTASSQLLKRFDKLSSSLYRWNQLGVLRKLPNKLDISNILSELNKHDKDTANQIDVADKTHLFDTNYSANLKLPYLVGVTGCIASGKSSICKKLIKSANDSNQNIYIIYCDQLAHTTYLPGTPAYLSIVNSFKDYDIFVDQIICDDSTKSKLQTSINATKNNEPICHPAIDRKKIGEIVFANREMLTKLNSIVWKFTKIKVIQEIISNCDKKVIFIEAALLFEAGWGSILNEVWVTWVNQYEAIRRIEQRDHLTENKALERFSASQKTFTNKQKIEMAHVLLSTIECENTTQKLVDYALNDLIKRIDN